MLMISDLKEKAKKSLSGKYGDAIGVIIILFLISLFIGILLAPLKLSDEATNSLSNFIEFVVSCLLTFGVISFFLKLSRDEEVEINELWSKTGMWYKFLGACAVLGIITSLIAIVGVVAAFIPLGFMINGNIFSNLSTTIVWQDIINSNMIIPMGALTILIAIITTIILVIVSTRYQLVFYILLDNPDMGIVDAFRLSSKMMKGHIIDYLALQLSFLGWMILGILTLGILYLWLIPYIAVTDCNFYNQLKKIQK